MAPRARERTPRRTGARPGCHERPRPHAIVRAALARGGENSPRTAPTARDARHHPTPNPRPAPRCAPRTSLRPHRRRPSRAGATFNPAMPCTECRAASESRKRKSDRGFANTRHRLQSARWMILARANTSGTLAASWHVSGRRRHHQRSHRARVARAGSSLDAPIGRRSRGRPRANAPHGAPARARGAINVRDRAPTFVRRWHATARTRHRRQRRLVLRDTTRHRIHDRRRDARHARRRGRTDGDRHAPKQHSIRRCLAPSVAPRANQKNETVIAGSLTPALPAECPHRRTYHAPSLLALRLAHALLCAVSQHSTGVYGSCTAHVEDAEDPSLKRVLRR
jgi:hypothetical protein